MIRDKIPSRIVMRLLSDNKSSLTGNGQFIVSIRTENKILIVYLYTISILMRYKADGLFLSKTVLTYDIRIIILNF